MVWRSKDDTTELNCILNDDDDTTSNCDMTNTVSNGNIYQDIAIPENPRQTRPNGHSFLNICYGTKRESLLWFIIAFIGTAVSTVIIFKLAFKYRRYDVVSEVTWNVTTKNYFPSITFCDVDLMFRNYFAYCGVPHGTKFDNHSVTCTYVPTKKKDHENFMNSTDRWNNGVFHVLRCQTWDGKNCTSNKYFKSVARLNHTCFTWNWNGNLYDMYGHAYIEFKVNQSSRPGRSVIFAEIHDPAVYEIGMSNSIRMEALKIYELRIRKTVIKRLPAPFPSRCVFNMPHHIFPGRYTRRTCIDSINYIEMLKQCGDILDYHKLHIPGDILRKYKRNRTISQAITCMLKYSTFELPEVSREKCPIACEKLDLYATTTYRNMNKAKSNSGETYAIDVQYHDIDHYKIVEERSKYTWEQLIAEIGGVIGLFVGASFITVVDLAIHFLRKYFVL